MKELMDKIPDIFIKAMLKESWAARNYKSRTILGLPGSILATDIIIDKWRVIDYFFTRGLQDSLSNGTTIIYCNNMPVWEMNYAGKYPDKTSSLVKDALMNAYQAFICCSIISKNASFLRFPEVILVAS